MYIVCAVGGWKLSAEPFLPKSKKTVHIQRMKTVDFQQAIHLLKLHTTEALNL